MNEMQGCSALCVSVAVVVSLIPLDTAEGNLRVCMFHTSWLQREAVRQRLLSIIQCVCSCVAVYSCVSLYVCCACVCASWL